MDKHNIYQLIRRASDGLVKSEHRDKLLRWITNRKDEREKEEALFRLWNETEDNEISSKETFASLLQVKSRLGIGGRQLKKQSSLLVHLWRYAAILIFPLVMGIFIWMYMNYEMNANVEMVECFVPNGEQKHLVLSDGTNVILNSGSLFIYPEKFSKDSRKVYLTGEAFFDVAHNKKKPFTVHTGRLNVEVLGTSFNVEAYSDDSEITTTLKQGSVNVFRFGQPKESGIVMKPNEQVVYHMKSGKMDLVTVNAEDYSSWTDGDLRFIERPLSEVLKVISRRYDVSFRCDDKINMEELYTTVFHGGETIEQVMEVMKSLIGNGMGYSIDCGFIHLYLKKKGGTTN